MVELPLSSRNAREFPSAHSRVCWGGRGRPPSLHRLSVGVPSCTACASHAREFRSLLARASRTCDGRALGAAQALDG